MVVDAVYIYRGWIDSVIWTFVNIGNYRHHDRVCKYLVHTTVYVQMDG